MSAFYIINTIYSSLIIHTTHAQLLNQYVESTLSNGTDRWESTSDFIPIRDQSYGTITIGSTMRMEFDFTFLGRTNDPGTDKFENFFRVGYDSAFGNNCSGQGSRYPSFWLSPDSDTMHVSVSQGNSECQPSYPLTNYGTITVGSTYHLIIAYNASLLTVAVSSSDRPDWDMSWARTPTSAEWIGTTAHVWFMSGKFGSSEYTAGYYSIACSSTASIVRTFQLLTLLSLSSRADNKPALISRIHPDL